MDDLELYRKSKYDLNTVKIVTNDIKMKFGIQQVFYFCQEERKRGRRQWNTNARSDSYSADAYKYLWVLESDQIKIKKIKLKVRQNYYRRIRKVLESRWNGGSTVKGINQHIGCCSCEVHCRKLMTMNNCTHEQNLCDLGRERKRLDVSGGCGESGVTQFVLLPEKEKRSI